jgi:hypothetical protein
MCRMLLLNPWRMLDLLHRRVAGTRLAGRALCSALHRTLTVIGGSISLLPTSLLQIKDIWYMLTETAGSCLAALGSIAVVLPRAVLQLVTRETRDGLAHDRGCWLLSVLEGIHELECAIGRYPASLEAVRLTTSLCGALGLQGPLAHMAVQLLSGIGCYHSQWQFAPTADCWQMAEAIILLLKSALEVGSVATPDDAADSHRSSLLNTMIQDGVLLRLFWVRPPHHAM